MSTEEVVKNAKPAEVEVEIRAQIERALAMGIHPTHLDSHMGVLFSSPDLFAVYVKLAREYKLPFLATLGPNAPPALRSQLTDKDAILDSVLIASPNIAASNWKNFYLDLIRNLKPGVTELIVHLGYDDAELQAVTVNHPDYGAAWRQRDFDVITSPEFKKALEENHVTLIRWSDIKKVIQ